MRSHIKLALATAMLVAAATAPSLSAQEGVFRTAQFGSNPAEVRAAVLAGTEGTAVTPVRWYGYRPYYGYRAYRPYYGYRPYYAYRPGYYGYRYPSYGYGGYYPYGAYYRGGYPRAYRW